MDTATVGMIALLVSVSIMFAVFGLERYLLYRKRTKHAH